MYLIVSLIDKLAALNHIEIAFIKPQWSSRINREDTVEL